MRDVDIIGRLGLKVHLGTIRKMQTGPSSIRSGSIYAGTICKQTYQRKQTELKCFALTSRSLQVKCKKQ